MKKFAALALLFGCGVSLLGPLSGCECLAVACTTSVSTKVAVSSDMASLQGAPVSACINDACAVGTLELLGDTGRVHCELSGVLPGADANCIATTVGSSTEVELTILFDRAEEEPPADDVYVFTITSASDPDEVLAEAQGQADISEWSEGGACGDQTCYQGKF